MAKEYPIIICGHDHEITSDMYCRALRFQGGDFGGSEYFQKSPRSGSIINNFKWTKVSNCLGPCWIDKGRTIAELYAGPTSPMEFCKGEPPPESILTEKDIGDY